MTSRIKTNKGVYFEFNSPEKHDFDVREIAYSLSFINRFTGHAGGYTVAQHSVLVSYVVPQGYALEGLLHDAAEAYIGDVSSPLKGLIRAVYKPIEHRIEAALSEQHRLCFPFPPCIKRADLVLLLTEHRDLMKRAKDSSQDTEHWPHDIEPLPRRLFGLIPAIIRWPAWYARYRFVKRYKELTQ
jgi:hypothetical protein